MSIGALTPSMTLSQSPYRAVTEVHGFNSGAAHFGDQHTSMKFPSQTTPNVLLNFILRLSVVFVAVAVPRLAVLGSPPSTDEGVYAYFSQIAHTSLNNGQGLPNTGALMLYPILLSWSFEFPFNHLMFLRILDMAISFVAGWILYGIVRRESRSALAAALISFVFLFTMNQPIFIQSGFKNSFFAAYVPLFLAAYLAQTAVAKETRRWFIVGGLLALTILLRETFIPFAVVAAIAILVGRGIKASLQYCFGGVVAGGLLLLLLLWARGGVHSLIIGYQDFGAIYASLSDRPFPLFLSNGTVAVQEMLAALALGGLSVAVTLFASSGKPAIRGRLWFWIAVSIVPLIEPITKIGFPYHFSACLPGLAGLSANGWRALTVNDGTRMKATIGALLLSVVVISLFTKYTPLAQTWSATRVNALNWDKNEWSADAVSSSNYLLAANALRKNAPPNGTLSVSGFMFALFPLSGLTPSDYELSHLTTLAIKVGLDKDKVRKALIECPPDVLMTSIRAGIPGNDAVTEAVEQSGLYHSVVTIPVSPEKSYGNFAGTIYKRSAGAGECKAHSN
ncbi:hypothetical protein [Rhizobium sp. 2MFCol3.1]|uniref:hypothetical protein n=1 Tax=Rhizobium sp. 2MFCol3.1 TaxID=1246459 RepID=UPI0003A0A459|nr:hypothetical protein [Rhizobium sp. 2MFCol3.1]